METNSNCPELSVVDHLRELRGRIIRAALAFGLLSIIFFPVAPTLLHWIEGQLFPTWQLYVFSPAEGVLVQTKLALVFGFAVSAPYILYQLWGFVAPALKETERRAFRGVVLPSLLLVILGLLFAWEVLLPVMLGILLNMTLALATPLFGLDKTLSLVTLFLFFSVFMFQIPLVLSILGRVGLVTYKSLSRQRKWAILILAIVAAIITPDNSPVTMMILAIPLYLLFELSIFLVGLAERRASRQALLLQVEK
jgi:sec-independent protein translocase protein TatC